MRILNYFLGVLVCATACTQKTSNNLETKKDTVQAVAGPKLYLKFIQYNYDNKKKKYSSKDSVMSVFNKDYLNVKLSLYLKGSFKAEVDDLTIISDEKGEDVWFEGSTQFLNFMSDKGYDMVDQTKNKYSIDYTFRKRINTK